MTAPSAPDWMRLSARTERPPHGVVFCPTDADLLPALVAYVLEGVESGERCVVLARAAHLAALHARLEEAGRAAEPLLVTRDAEPLLAALRAPGGKVDPTRFTIALRALLPPPEQPVRVFAELVDLLVEDGDLAAALHLERLWTQAQEQRPFPLLCAHRTQEAAAQHRVLGCHDHLVQAA